MPAHARATPPIDYFAAFHYTFFMPPTIDIEVATKARHKCRAAAAFDDAADTPFRCLFFLRFSPMLFSPLDMLLRF